VAAPDSYIAEHLSSFLDDFAELIAIPSISTDPGHTEDVRKAAGWVRQRMEQAGLSASVEETGGHPVVLGRHDAGPGAPTLLVYAHYDVQPADPLGEWRSPPFELTREGENFVARGAADDKAQVILQIGAAEAALRTTGLPVSLTLLFEGEEEVGSTHLPAYVAAHRKELRADHAVIADSMMFSPTRPSLIFGTRGMAYVEIAVRTATHDLHSGQYGGAVSNPAHVLARIIASFHHPDGRVAIEGFYDDVLETPADLRAGWAALGYDEAAFQRSAGGAALRGEPGYSTPERLWIRPCLDVNGIVGGYTGPGKKTVLPASAKAKVSCRLVPDQDPADVARLLRRHLDDHGFKDVKADLLGAEKPARTPLDAPFARVCADAAKAVWNVTPVVTPMMAGSGPMHVLGAKFGIPTVMPAGIGYAGCNVHAPNENVRVDDYIAGIKYFATIFADFAH